MPALATFRGVRRHGLALLNFLRQDSLDFAEIARLDSKFRLAPMATTEGRIITVGMTGASGAAYAQAVLRLLDSDRRVERVFLVASDAGLRLLSTELGIVASDAKRLPALLTGTAAKKFEYLPNKDIGASIASGSARIDAMAVVPCSAGALGSIAAGTASDLLTRAADVCLKERRPLVLCLRETPLNRIHLENMLRVHDAGATVMPAMPAFYFKPKTIADIVEQFAYRVLAQMGLPQDEQYRWKGKP
jgi:flavin prenyltransferase